MFPDSFYTYGMWNWRAMTLVWGTVAILIGGLILGLFASGVLSGKDFTCPKGQHEYVVTFIPIMVGKTVVLSPVYGCEAN